MAQEKQQSGAPSSPAAKPAGSADEKAAGTPGGSKIEERADGSDAGEIGGPAGPEPTRYGDWEVGGRCTDF